jgi:hypothetical protein
MRQVERASAGQTRCATCGQVTPDYDLVHYGSIEDGYRQLCNECLNTEVAKSDGLDKFEHVRFNPVEVADCTGEAHVFHFRTRLFGRGVALDAFELHGGYPAGYQLQIIGEPQEELLVLLGRLIAKIRRALSIKHVKDGELGLQIADHLAVQGTIESDSAEDGRVPLLVVDGREITWDEFGRMILTCEGWQFRLEIRDKSDEF